MATEAPRPGIDYRDEALARDPFPIYKRMREEFPICYLGGKGSHMAVSRYDDAKQILSDHETFLSGNDIVGSPEWIEEKYKRDLFILTMEPPEHSRYRALVSKGFVPKILAALEPFIQAAAKRLIDQVKDKQSFDFLSEFSLPYAISVISQITGDTAQSVEDLSYWTQLVDKNSFITPDQQHIEALQKAILNQYAVYDRIIAERRADRKPGLVTELINARIGDEELTDGDIRAALDLFVSAGFQSSALTLTNAVHLLSKYPDVFMLLKSKPELMPAFVDEVVRFNSPAQALLRHVSRDTAINGIHIPKGALVSVILGSANRDEMKFVNPDEFNIQRSDIKKQIGFGHGVHTCIGASLARIEVATAVGELVRYFSSVECPAASELAWTNTLSIRAIKSLPTKFR